MAMKVSRPMELSVGSSCSFDTLFSLSSQPQLPPAGVPSLITHTFLIHAYIPYPHIPSLLTHTLGLLKLASSSYLVAISRREQIAQIRGKPVYVITGVDLIPLSSQSEAQAAITHARTSSARKSAAAIQDDDTDTDDDASSSSAATAAEHDEEQDSVPSTPIQDTPGGSRSGRLQKSTTVVADVIKNKGSYGRFAQKWFSKAGWTTEGRRKQGMSSDNLSSITSEQEKAAQDALPDGKEHEADVAAIETADPVVDETSTGEQPPSSLHAVMENLTPRILRTTKLFFASHSFYFSYDYDISRSLPRQENTSSTVPLYKRFDPLVSIFHSFSSW